MTEVTPDNAARSLIANMKPATFAAYSHTKEETLMTLCVTAEEHEKIAGALKSTVAALEAEVDDMRLEVCRHVGLRRDAEKRADAAERRVAELEAEVERLRDSLDALIQAASPMVTADIQHERVVEKGSRGHTSISIDPFPLMKFRHEDMRDLKSELDRARTTLTGARAK